MSTLIVLGYPSEEEAKSAYQKVLDLDKNLIVSLQSIAVVARHADGKYDVVTPGSKVGTSTVWGLFWGVLFGLLFFVPVFGAAIGAGIDITKPDGHMVVDIGGGTSDIAVISLSGVVESASIKVAGDQFNESVVKYMRRKHNILIGERTAEQMKMEIGCVYPKEEEATVEIKGRCLMTGLPKTITVNSTEMMEAFEEPVERILEAVHNVLERTPPELVADISNNGIVMTGGGSLVDGFDKLITARTGIHTVVAEDAISCVAEGTGKSLDSLGDMQDGTVNLSRRRQMN